MTKNPYHFQTKTNGQLKPSMAALAFVSGLTEKDFNDVYMHAAKVDRAFAHALEEARQEERDRIFRMGFVELLREYWRGRKIYRKP